MRASIAASSRFGSWWRERELLDSGRPGNSQRIFDRAVSPADLLRIFAREILRIVHHQIGAREEFGVTMIFPGYLARTGRKRTRVRFVVTRIDDGNTVRLHTIAESQCRM